MKNPFTTIGRLLGLAAITALCMVPPVRAGTRPTSEQSNASSKPSHRSTSRRGLPFPTASTVRELIADINYANKVGGAVTIRLAPGTTFNLKRVNNTTDGGNGLPVIGGTKPVALTIIGNGATIKRTALISRYSIVKNPFRLFDVASGASLTLDQVTLKGGGTGDGGAILNRGTLNLINSCTLSGNHAGSGGGIANVGGIVTISDDSVMTGNSAGSGGGIHNSEGGTVTISDSTLSGNFAFYNGGGIYNSNGTVTASTGVLSENSARFGGGIYNSGGTVTLSSGSTLTDNAAYHSDYPWAGGDGGGIYNDAGTVTISDSTLSGNTADEDSRINGSGGGIYNKGEFTVENSSSITGNTASGDGGDVNNLGVLHVDGTSTIGNLHGNPAIRF